MNRDAFPHALAGGLRVSSAHFKASVPKEARGYAVVVPKKVARLSVTRHRIKRQVASALRANKNLPPALILFPQPSVARMKYHDIVADIDSLLSKIRR